MDDCRKRQTSTATPAEPGDLPWGLGMRKSVYGALSAAIPVPFFEVPTPSAAKALLGKPWGGIVFAYGLGPIGVAMVASENDEYDPGIAGIRISSDQEQWTFPLPHSGQNCGLCHFGMLARRRGRQSRSFECERANGQDPGALGPLAGAFGP
jgi:hypothetical protein